MRRVLTVLAMLAFAVATMGQDGCDTDTDGGRSANQAQKREQQREARQRARERQRERAHDARVKARQEAAAEAEAAEPEPEPEPEAAPIEDCHPEYGGCLDPNSSDYDCEGGSGDGPDYTGTVESLGSDPYGLDDNSDGIGCDP